MTSYQNEQLEALRIVRRYFENLPAVQLQHLKREVAGYLDFRQDVQSFLDNHFSGTCTYKCYQSRRSACCSREGIITFFADVFINALVSEPAALDLLETILKRQNKSLKCIYLGTNGCLWALKPIVCEMFLCDTSRREVFDKQPHLQKKWDELQRRKQNFTWPDKPILFDAVEKRFIDIGLTSTLMYLHNSPGLLRIKKQWQQVNRSESS